MVSGLIQTTDTFSSGGYAHSLVWRKCCIGESPVQEDLEEFNLANSTIFEEIGITLLGVLL